VALPTGVWAGCVIDVPEGLFAVGDKLWGIPLTRELSAKDYSEAADWRPSRSRIIFP
jgi:hypothetical protein